MVNLPPKYTASGQRDWQLSDFLSGKIFIAIGLLILLLIGAGVSLGTFADVQTGYSSVIVNTWDNNPNTAVRAGPLGPINAPFLKNPVTENIVPIYTAVSNLKMCGGYDNNLTELANGQPGQGCDAASPIGTTSDQIRVAVDLNIFWTVNNQGDKLVSLYRNYPSLDYSSKVFVPTIREVVREVIANRTFDQVFAELNSLPAIIANKTVSTILANPTLAGTINLDPASIQITNVHMSNGLQQSLQQKKQSEIGIQTAENQRNQTIINADAARQQAVLAAQGIAQSQVIQANATKQSILTVLQSIGCGDNQTCQQQAGDLYLQLLNYKQICANTTNCIFMIGQGSSGQPIIYQLPANPPNTNSTK